MKQLYLLGSSLKQNISPRPGSAPSSYTISDGLVGYWTFDGKDTNWTSVTAGTVTDNSGQGNTGTFTSMNQAASPVPGKLGQGLNFDGVDDLVRVPNHTSLNMSGAMTISAWVFMRSSTANFQVLTSKHVGSGGYALYADGSGGPATFSIFNAACSVETTVDTTAALPTKKWIHLIAIYEPSTALRVYQDSVLNNSSTTSIPSSQCTNTEDLGIGARTDASRSLNSIADDVRIYNRALSANEVKQLYLLGSSLKQNVTPRYDVLDKPKAVILWPP